MKQVVIMLQPINMLTVYNHDFRYGYLSGELQRRS